MLKQAYTRMPNGKLNIQTNISILSTSRTTGSFYPVKKNMETLAGISEFIFNSKNWPTDIDVLKKTKNIMKNIIITDKDGNILDAEKNMFDYFQYDKPTLLFGKIISRKNYTTGSFKNKSSIKIQYLSWKNEAFEVSVIVNTEAFDKELNNTSIHDDWILGICERKKYIYTIPGKYDRITRSVYGGKVEERTKNKLYSYIILNNHLEPVMK